MSVVQYIGARYVPKFYVNSVDGTTEWETNVTYEPLTWVSTPNGSMYMSKKTVPDNIGSPAQYSDYWLEVGQFNGYIQQLQDEIDIINNTDLPAIDNRLDNLEAFVDGWVDAFCVIRKESDGTWIVLDDATHTPQHVSGIQLNAQGRLEVLFDKNYSEVGTGSLFPDETYTVQKITAGASISTDRAVIYMTQRPLGGFFYFNNQTVTYDANLKGDIESVEWCTVGNVTGFKIHFAPYAQCNRTVAVSYSLLQRAGQVPASLQFRTFVIGAGTEAADVILVPTESITNVNSGIFVEIIKQPEVLPANIPYNSAANFWFTAKLKP